MDYVLRRISYYVAFVVVIWAAMVGSVLGAGDWGYLTEGSGPSNWQRSYPLCRRENHQSPINLEFFKAGADVRLKPITFSSYDNVPVGETWNVTNNGHTVVLTGQFRCAPHIQDGALGGNYDVVQIHFHWANDSNRGSEHYLDGRQYPLEMHIVHQHRDNPPWKGPKDKSAPLNLAVVGVIFEEADKDNDDLKPLVDVLPKVERAEKNPKKVVMKEFNLKALLPSSPDYFRYNGSLTTPPCNPVVLWSVFRQVVPVSRGQLSAFRRLLANAPADNQTRSVYITENYRPLQDLANRTVLVYSHSIQRPENLEAYNAWLARKDEASTTKTPAQGTSDAGERSRSPLIVWLVSFVLMAVFRVSLS